MRDFWEKLFDKEPLDESTLESLEKLKNEIENDKRRLKMNLSKQQKRLLLRIEDGKDAIAEEGNLGSFVAGFKIGLKIGYESNRG